MAHTGQPAVQLAELAARKPTFAACEGQPPRTALRCDWSKRKLQRVSWRPTKGLYEPNQGSDGSHFKDRNVNQLRSLLLTSLILLGTAVPVYAQVDGYADLGVCNKGTVPVEVVAATKNLDLLRGVGKYYWNIEGTAVAPGKCKNVYHDTDAGGAYLAFGFYDAKGQWGSGTIAQVPNLGTHSVYFREYPVLTSASKGVCARLDATEYNTPDDPQIDCASIRLTAGVRKEVGHGAFFPLTSALYFEPEGTKCIRVNSQTNCNGGDYYLNISPSVTDRELHAARGTAGGADAPPPVDSATALKNLAALIAKADAENQQRQQQAAADAANANLDHAREQQAAREQKQKQILAADAAGDPNAKVEAQMIRREEEGNRQRWAGTRQSPAAYDPQWNGQNIAIVGTVSRVEIDPSGSPQWVSIYFKESPDATFVVCSPYPDLFQERVGLNLSALVGKTLQAAGQVESPYCGAKTSKGSIRVLVSTQWQVR